MQLSAKQISSASFYILLSGGIIAYFIASFLFAEKLQANNGLGWDGYKYASIAADLLNSASLDSYLMMRILPSTWVHVVFKLLAIEFTPANVISAFECINLFSILTGTLVTKRLMEHFNIQPMLQLLGLFLLLINYAVLNFTVYYPVMLDSVGFALGAVSLYFYVKKESANLWLTSLIGFFTLPTVGITGIILLIFPFEKHHSEEKNSIVQQFMLPTLAFLYITVVCAYHVYVTQMYKPMAFTLKLDRDLAPISIFTLGLTVFWWTTWASKIPYLSFSFWKKSINFSAIFGVVTIVLIVLLIKNIRVLPSHEFFNEFILTRSQITLAAVKPLITIVCNVNYYGSLLILLLLFNQSVMKNISKIGTGFTVSLTLNLILFGIMTESRAVINFLPWLVILFVVSVNQLTFRYYLFIPAVALNILSSKVWLKVGEVSNSGLNADGTIGFPFQKFFMNIGPWMSTEMWQLFTVIFIAAFVINFFTFFTLKFTQGKIKLNKRFRESVPSI